MKSYKTKTKKILVMLIIIITLLGTLPLTAFAKFITDMDDNAEFGVISGSKSDYGHELHYAKYDDKKYIVFCCQYGKTSPSGKEYTYNEDFQIELKNDRKSYEKIAEYIYFGYTMKYGTGLPTTTVARKAACATQQFVWEYIKDNINDEYGAPARSSWNSNYMSSTIYKDWLEETEKLYEEYHDKQVSLNGKTRKINIGESMTFTDQNNILENYEAFEKTINEVTFKHSKGSNDLVVSVADDCTATKVTFESNKYDIYKFLPDGSKYTSDKMSDYMYFHFKGAIQNLIFSNYIDPKFFNFSISVESGDIELTKIDDNNKPLGGCQFEIFKDEGCKEKVATATTDDNGKILFNHLVPSIYYIKETRCSKGIFIRYNCKKGNSKKWRNITSKF